MIMLSTNNTPMIVFGHFSCHITKGTSTVFKYQMTVRKISDVLVTPEHNVNKWSWEDLTADFYILVSSVSRWFEPLLVSMRCWREGSVCKTLMPKAWGSNENWLSTLELQQLVVFSHVANTDSASQVKVKKGPHQYLLVNGVSQISIMTFSANHCFIHRNLPQGF